MDELQKALKSTASGKAPGLAWFGWYVLRDLKKIGGEKMSVKSLVSPV